MQILWFVRWIRLGTFWGCVGGASLLILMHLIAPYGIWMECQKKPPAELSVRWRFGIPGPVSRSYQIGGQVSHTSLMAPLDIVFLVSAIGCQIFHPDIAPIILSRIFVWGVMLIALSYLHFWIVMRFAKAECQRVE